MELDVKLSDDGSSDSSYSAASDDHQMENPRRIVSPKKQGNVHSSHKSSHNHNEKLKEKVQ